jgi:mRNA interferase MazF
MTSHSTGFARLKFGAFYVADYFRLFTRRSRMAKILRGDVFWADLNPFMGREQAGLRPVLILNHTIFNELSGTVIAVAITSQPQRAGFPLTLELTNSKLPKQSCVKINQIRTLSVKRLREKICSATDEELSRVTDGLNEIVGGYPWVQR